MTIRLSSLSLASRSLHQPRHSAPCWHSNPQPRDLKIKTFHTRPALHATAHTLTHYETLGLSPSASQKEVKTQFYALSKTHHPDRNPSDPEAAQRFVAISAAYATIGNPAKRQKYDREVLAPQQQAASAAGSTPAGSAFSGHAGGRKASGLSTRRTAFRGPPPSFYRSGGWGAHGAKRAEHASAAGGGAADGQPADAHRPHAYAGARGEAPYPYAATDRNDVPHFDRDGHYHVQSTVEEQLRQGRARRRSAQMRERKARGEDAGLGFGAEQHGGSSSYGDGSANVFSNFLIVSGVVLVGVGGPVLLISGWDRRREGKKAWGGGRKGNGG